MGKGASKNGRRGGPRVSTLEKAGISLGISNEKKTHPVIDPVESVKSLVPARGPQVKTAAKESKRGRGRPEFEATQERRRYVEAASALGATPFDIARILQCSEETLKKHFAEELELGKVKLDLAIGSALAKRARDGNIQAAMFYLMRKGGWGNTAAPDVGKKELAAMAAQTAHRGTAWDDLLDTEPPPAAVPLQ